MYVKYVITYSFFHLLHWKGNIVDISAIILDIWCKNVKNKDSYIPLNVFIHTTKIASSAVHLYHSVLCHGVL